MGKETGSGLRDEKPGSYFRELRNQFFGLNSVLKLFDADPGSGMEKIQIRIVILEVYQTKTGRVYYSKESAGAFQNGKRGRKVVQERFSN
jgi:hypothetical protein